ncbi:MAG TPA: hypothetical protein ENK26_00430 [Gammaproteobacteria bacterium]|nr:hypothetical protein [Gammaproteobacteria bacterium]
MPRPVETITVTELARNLATVIDHVRISSTQVSITRGSQTVAKLSPVVQPGLTLGGLLDVLQRSPLADDERQDYAADLELAHDSASIPPSPWE